MSWIYSEKSIQRNYRFRYTWKMIFRVVVIESLAPIHSYVISNFALQGKDATLLSPVVAAAAMTAATLVVVRTMLIFISIEATVAVTIPPVRKAVSLSRLVEMILLKGVIWTPPPIAAKPNGLVAPLPLRIRREMRGG